MTAKTVDLRMLQRNQQRNIWTILLLWFLMNAGFFLIIPLLSVHYVDQLGWAAAFIGLVLAIRQFTQQGLSVFGGALADRFSARTLVLIGLLIRAISFVLMGSAQTHAMLLLAGVLAALGGALFDAPTQAILTAVAPKEQLADLYAKTGVLQNTARTIGPIVGAILINFDFKVVGWASGGFFLLAWVVGYFGLPDIAVSTEKQTVAKGIGLAFHDRTFVTYIILMMGFWFMWVQMSLTFPLKVQELTGQSSSVGVLLTVNAVIAILLQVPALKLAQKYLQPMPILIVGVAVMALGLGMVVWVTTVTQLYVTIFFFALGTVLGVPTANTVTASMANPLARGAYFGVGALALAVGGGLGQLAGGVLVDWSHMWHWPALPWLVFSITGIVAAVGLTLFYQQKVEPQRQALTAVSGD